jgi:uncharacterized protein (DUF1501 family)
MALKLMETPMTHDTGCETCRWVVPSTVAGWPAWMPRLAFRTAAKGSRGDVLLVVFLRGAADCLNVVVPHGEEAYYRLRPSLSIPRPDDRRAVVAQRAVDLDGFFGLHPALAPLLPAWQAGHWAIVHACGAPDESRSHFQAMELMERGLTDLHGPASGWISRHLASFDTGNTSPLRAVGIGEQVQRSLRGVVPASALQSIADYHLGGDRDSTARLQAALASLYGGDDPLGQVGRETLSVLETLSALEAAGYQPRPEALYPESDFGMGLRQVAALIRADVGLEAAAIDVGGWDTHFGQGGSEGLMAGLLADLGQGLSALHADLVDRIDDLTVVVMTEFGRRAVENASLGTDHGHGGAMFVLGGGVEGGRVHALWPGLDHGQLFGPGDLAVTIDYRDVLAEICQLRLNNPSVEAVFPDFRPAFRGIVRPRG